MNEELVGIEEIMKKLGVARKTIYKWIYEKKYQFPYYKISHKLLRFRLSEIEEWLQKYKVEQ